MVPDTTNEKEKWDQMMENFELLYECLNAMGLTQQALKTQIKLNNTKVDQCSQDQKLIAKKVQANGQAIAQLTL